MAAIHQLIGFFYSLINHVLLEMLIKIKLHLYLALKANDQKRSDNGRWKITAASPRKELSLNTFIYHICSPDYCGDPES